MGAEISMNVAYSTAYGAAPSVAPRNITMLCLNMKATVAIRERVITEVIMVVVATLSASSSLLAPISLDMGLDAPIPKPRAMDLIR